MALPTNLFQMSEDELTKLISAASERRGVLRESRERETGAGLYGTPRQDVHDPKHGMIPVPTPNAVKDVGPEHGVDDYKPRDAHVGQPTARLGSAHFEKDALEAAAHASDQGPSFGTPGTPPEQKSESVTDVEQAFPTAASGDGVMR